MSICRDNNTSNNKNVKKCVVAFMNKADEVIRKKKMKSGRNVFKS